MPVGKLSARDVILQDLWIHLSGMIAIALGAVAWFSRSGFHSDPSSLELMFMIGGFAGMGLKIINGSAAQLRQAAVDTAFTAARAAETARLAAVTAAATMPAPPPPAAT